MCLPQDRPQSPCFPHSLTFVEGHSSFLSTCQGLPKLPLASNSSQSFKGIQTRCHPTDVREAWWTRWQRRLPGRPLWAQDACPRGGDISASTDVGSHEGIRINHHLEHDYLKTKPTALTYGTLDYGCGNSQEKKTKSNLKSRPRLPWPLGCSTWVPQSLFCPPHTTSSVGKPWPTTGTCWSVVPGLAWLCRAEQKVCKYPEVFNLPEKKSEEEIRF